MKPQKILLFIILIIFCLTLISLLFPSSGVIVFDKILRFPAIHEIVTYTPVFDFDPEEILKEWEIHALNEDDDNIQSIDNKINNESANPYIESSLKKIETIFELPSGNRSFFDGFFAKAEAARGLQKIVRVLYYGDSQIELDRFSFNLRTFFQQKFGGGGPGMVPFHQTIPNGALNQYYSGEYERFSLWGEIKKNKENDYGPLAKMFRINGNNSFTATAPSRKSETDRRDHYANISLLINNFSDPFSAVLSDKTNQTKYDLQTGLLGIQLLHFKLDLSTQSFSIALHGNANIYGVMIDDGFGVAVDNIAMRGANGLHFTSMNDSLMRIIFKLIDVEMVVLQFGGNAVPGLSSEKSVDLYVSNIVGQIKYLRRILPDIPILFIGPSDMLAVVEGELVTYKCLPYLVEKLRLEIPQSGAAFWNIYEVMGGANSMRSWVKKGWAGNDYVHFTAKGANEIATVLVQTFETMYEHYKMK